MRILITNDDGINAPGLKVLATIAAQIAGPDGKVWTVAPAFEQSGVAHCVSFTHPTMIAKMGPRRFAAEGSPADCVLAGIYDVMADAAPDLILSGVNHGNNTAENVMYSGTIGGVMEAALHKIPSIALSQFLGPMNANHPNPFDAAAQHGVEMVKLLLERAPWDRDQDYQVFYNVNFPPVPATAVKGIKVTSMGFRRSSSFSVAPCHSPLGRKFLWIQGGDAQERTAPGTDAAANLDGYISVTPMRADLTDYSLLEPLRAKLQ